MDSRPGNCAAETVGCTGEGVEVEDLYYSSEAAVDRRRSWEVARTTSEEAENVDMKRRASVRVPDKSLGDHGSTANMESAPEEYAWDWAVPTMDANTDMKAVGCKAGVGLEHACSQARSWDHG